MVGEVGRDGPAAAGFDIRATCREGELCSGRRSLGDDVGVNGEDAGDLTTRGPGSDEELACREGVNNKRGSGDDEGEPVLRPFSI